MKRLVLIAAFAAATAAQAQRIVFETRPPYYRDDTIIFYLDLPQGAYTSLSAGGLNIYAREFAREAHGSMQRMWYSALPENEGPAVLPAIEVREGSRPPTTLPPTTLKIEPQRLSEMFDEATLAQKLRATNRSVVTARLSVPASVYAGEIIDAQWSVFSDPRAAYNGSTRDITVGTEMDRISGWAADAVGGAMGFRMNVARRALLARTPGIITIPPAMIEVQVERNGGMVPYRRFANAAQITVVPAPRSDAPIGRFRISRLERVTDKALYPHTYRVSIAGTGELAAHLPPLLKDAQFAVLARPGEVGFITKDRGRLELERDWTLELHPKASSTIPDLSFAFYDPQLQRQTEITAPLPPLEGQPKTAAASATAAGSRAGGIVSLVLLAVAGILFGLVALIRHVCAV